MRKAKQVMFNVNFYQISIWMKAFYPGGILSCCILSSCIFFIFEDPILRRYFFRILSSGILSCCILCSMHCLGYIDGRIFTSGIKDLF